MNVNELLIIIDSNPETIDFSEVLTTIDTHYEYTPTRFCNGIGEDAAISEAGSNEGSCKIFAFSQLNELDENQTLACFGSYYREDVLEHPEKKDHANIRHFMIHGWSGISFDGIALKLR